MYCVGQAGRVDWRSFGIIFSSVSGGSLSTCIPAGHGYQLIHKIIVLVCMERRATVNGTHRG